MFNIDHINELRAELAGCCFTKNERRQIEGELAALLAERDNEEEDAATGNFSLTGPFPVRADPTGEGARAPLIETHKLLAAHF
jgi:hypothetical protein